VFVPLTNVGLQNESNHTHTPSVRVTATLPRVPQVHLFDTEFGTHLLVVNGSRIYNVSSDIVARLAPAMEARDSSRIDTILTELDLMVAPYIDDEPPAEPPVRALSLAVSQKCNLGCTYCYAQEGSFGATPKHMTLEVALASVDLLLGSAAAGDRVNLAFLGGEPLANRRVLYATTAYASQRAAERGISITFSITTNGTLLTREDGDFFERYGFAVTLSLDGVGNVHDQLRSFKGGRASYDRIIERVMPLLRQQQRMQVSARVTVTPLNLRLAETLDAFIGLGFHSVGFSPMLSSPTGRHEMNTPELEEMLDQMIACGREFERHIINGGRYPFLNMVNAMREIHKGTHRPYACGAGAGYFGVSADGDLAACHRFVGDEAGAMGNLSEGVDRNRQSEWLAQRHVHRQEPCNSCWARYLCGGGCHHEVIQRGRPACHYIRGWLHYCLQAYIRLSSTRPDYFTTAHLGMS